MPRHEHLEFLCTWSARHVVVCLSARCGCSAQCSTELLGALEVAEVLIAWDALGWSARPSEQLKCTTLGVRGALGGVLERRLVVHLKRSSLAALGALGVFGGVLVGGVITRRSTSLLVCLLEYTLLVLERSWSSTTWSNQRTWTARSTWRA